ncbi:hypothetical protein GW17_00024607 [Ensete ventricosum]|nr:hypothetical protein GW17_00024607 [Ensete ventricosum]
METWMPSLPSVLQESTRYHGPWRSSSLGGTTESNNVSVEGLVVTTHKCVLDSCRHLQQEGYDVDCLAVRLVGLGVFFYTHSTQTLGKIPIDVEKTGIGLISLRMLSPWNLPPFQGPSRAADERRRAGERYTLRDRPYPSCRRYGHRLLIENTTAAGYRRGFV